MLTVAPEFAPTANAPLAERASVRVSVPSTIVSFTTLALTKVLVLPESIVAAPKCNAPETSE